MAAKAAVSCLLASATLASSAVPRRAAIFGATLCFSHRRPADAQPNLYPMYCIPGVTADRCRGVFWETGKLYRKGDLEAPFSTEEYERGVASLKQLRSVLTAERESTKIGETASRARAELRQLGGRICRALEEDERYEQEYKLNEVMSALDDVDVAALRESGQSRAVAPGFSESTILLDRAIARLDDFLRTLPSSPPA